MHAVVFRSVGGDSEVFCTAGVTPICAEVGDWGPQKSENLNKFCDINAPHRRILCTIFMKFLGIVGIFLLGCIKIQGNSIEGLQSYGF